MAPLPVTPCGPVRMMAMDLLVGCLHGGNFRGRRGQAKCSRRDNEGKYQNKSLHTSSHLNFSYFIIMFFKAIHD
jgi:hypothetical protein